MRGQDAQYQLTLDFLDAVNGTTRRVTLPDGRTLDVRIPAGVRDGQVIRLKGQGMPGIGDGAPGDALVEVAVAPHPLFRREGDDIIVELPVTLQEAVLGTTLEVPTIKGPVRLTIPPNSGRGTRLRLRGRGIEGKGHQFVELHPVLPPDEEPELAEFLKTWKPRHPIRSARWHGDRVMDVTAVAALFPDLTQVELITWVERGWVIPDTADAGLEFHEIDVARVRLIHDLRHDMDIGEDAIPLVLSLLDQVYELRSRLKAMLRAVEAQPSDVQLAILEALQPDYASRDGAETRHGLPVCGVCVI